jgi:hypothetical protein
VLGLFEVRQIKNSIDWAEGAEGSQKKGNHPNPQNYPHIVIIQEASWEDLSYIDQNFAHVLGKSPGDHLNF